MLTFESRMTLTGVACDDITMFMLECEDARYQSWWPGTHLAFHLMRPGPGHDHVGDVVWMDEFVGSRRLRMPFARELDEHAHTEFPMLADLLHRGAA